MLCVRGWWSSPAVGFLLVSLSCRAGHTLSARLRLVGSAIDAEVGAQTARAIDAALASANEAGKPVDGAATPSRARSRRGQLRQSRSRRPAPRPPRRRSRRASEIGSCARVIPAISCARSSLRSTKLGYDLQGTGNYGPKTESVVADFQARHGLEVDGEIGSETAKAIDAVLASATANKPAADGADTSPPLVPPAPSGRVIDASALCSTKIVGNSGNRQRVLITRPGSRDDW